MRACETVRCKVKSNHYKTGISLLLLFNLGAYFAFGYSDSFLVSGDSAMLAAPVANFRCEIDRIKLPAPEFHAVPVSNDLLSESNSAIEMADLRAALQKVNKPAADIERIVQSHLLEWNKLNGFNQAVAAARWQGSHYDENGNQVPNARGPVTFPNITFTKGLPAEFADYFEGIVAWSNPAVTDKTMARGAWQRILDRPAGERHFKSTAAAFMLAKSWEQEDPDKAVDCYKKACALARAGFSDSSGLAAASIGWEARIFYLKADYIRAIELYLQQNAAGDISAKNSLTFSVEAALRGGAEAFPALAKNPLTRRVITGHIISIEGFHEYGRFDRSDSGTETNGINSRVSDWLAAAEAADVKDAESIEELALAACQNGQWDVAQEWIGRARSSPTAQWLQAKLLLRSGKTNEAGALLAKVAKSFPLKDRTTNAPLELKDNLGRYGYPFEQVKAPDMIQGELAVFNVARGEYSDALDRFLRAGFWQDAAYVAERLVTLDELKSYVDRNWHAAPASTNDDSGSDDEISPRGKIRWLLARRLTRALRGDEAGEYYPSGLKSTFDALTQGLAAGWNESLPAAERAKALFAAATITRSNGMELIGTEAGPDWRMCDGDSGGRLRPSYRTNENFTLFPAGADELRRFEQNKADPEEHLHYRYQAASLAWEAAKLMPNNSDAKARVLCAAGAWIKARDPQTADIFYKALVRLCRKTAIGQEADRIRWFPLLDEDGNVIPRKSRGESAEPPAPDAPAQPEIQGDQLSTEYPVPGKSYIVHLGDTLGDIAEAAAAPGQPVSAQSILDANPGLDAASFKAGLKILIPASNSGQNEPPSVSEFLDTKPANDPVPVPTLTGDTEYIVMSGDTLSAISAKFGVTPKAVRDANHLPSNSLKVGQRISIPAPPP
jgi:nucleoid-associated protein YgaU